LVLPVLLYHHVSDSEKPGPYSLSVSQFRGQMLLLKQLGYTPLLTARMVNLLQNGGPAPPRPVIITFDDGHLDVYHNALPILQELSFPAVMYVILKSVGAETNLSAEQIRELAAAGWEIGSHSYSHPDLAKSTEIHKEICGSKSALEAISGAEIVSFAYPFGLADLYTRNYVRDCGYLSGAGLGNLNEQTLKEVYYFPRLPVDGRWSLTEFASRLPWGAP